MLNVLPDYFDRRTATTTGKVSGGPQCLAPQFLLNAGILSFSDKEAVHALQALNPLRDCHLGWIFHQKMDMAVLAIKFHPFRFKVDTHACEDALKVFQNGFCEYAVGAPGQEPAEAAQAA